MALKLGTTTASLYLGSTPVAAYLGATQVYSAATVPGAPTWDGTPPASGGDEFDYPFLAPADDGGSEITGYNIYVDDELISDNQDPAVLFAVATFAAPGTYEIAVAAVNAVGEGPRLTTVYEFVED
jgi:hypothetical protein